MKGLAKNRKLIIFVAIVVALVAVAVVFLFVKIGNSAEAKKSIEMGNRYLSELKYDEAIACFQQALEIDPRNSEASYALAEAYDGNQMYVYAESVYRGLIEDTGDSEAYLKLAELYMREDKLEEAKELLETAKSQLENEDIAEMYAMANPQAPTVSHEPGAYTDRIRLSLIPEEPSQTIYYTLDGTEPTEESLVYEKPLILRNGVTTIKAMAINAMGYRSETVEFAYDTQIADIEMAIEEQAIDRMIREYLGIPYGEPLYNDDVEQITEIYVISNQLIAASDNYSVIFEENCYELDGYASMTPYAQGVLTTLNDLKKMPFLERVAVEYQPGLDISALAECTAITELSLMGNALDSRDIQALSGLTQLEKLNLGWNDIDNVSALAGLTNLTYCGVWGNNISDISPMAACQQLVYLDFADNQVTDISALSGLGNLLQLWMYHNQVTDISAVAEIDSLQVLMVRDNPIENPETVRPIYSHLTRLDVDLLNLGANAE